MRIKMLVSCNGSANKEGSISSNYKRNEIYDMKEPWQKNIANAFISADLAVEVKTEEPKETKAKPKKRKKIFGI